MIDIEKLSKEFAYLVGQISSILCMLETEQAEQEKERERLKAGFHVVRFPAPDNAARGGEQ